MKHLYQLRLFALCTIIGLLCNFSSHAQVQATWYSFSSAAGTYAPLVGGNKVSFPDMNDDNVDSIPIGFKFNFCDADYDMLSVCTNGWVSFSNTSSNTNWNDPGTGIEPALMPFFDDLSGAAGLVSYLTTGPAGKQVFTMEWRDWTWGAQMSSPVPVVLSFQVRLYEETGRIEFSYDEGPDKIFGKVGATIGIISSNSDFQTLDDAVASPGIAKGYNDGITSRPPTGTLYIWDPPVPCPAIAPVTISNYNSTAATFGWTNAPGAIEYEYVIDKSATAKPGPSPVLNSTTGTLAAETGLTPATHYYIHVRSKCGKTSYSQWDTVSFETYPACSKPRGIKITNVDSTSVDFNWPVVPTATVYEYIVNDDASTPASNAGATTQAGTGVSISTGLVQGKQYYVHYRSLCAGDDSSAWALDSFRIPFACRMPVLQVTNLQSDRAIINWADVHTAATYEYVISKNNTPPAFGTTIIPNLIQATTLTPSTVYNAYVRCNCAYYGMKANSDWANIEFKTLFPTGIGNVDAGSTGLSVYPNPATGIAYVSVSSTLTDKSRLTLTDVTGKVLKQIPVTAAITEVNTTALAPGMYFLNYADGEVTKTIKLTKQ